MASTARDSQSATSRNSLSVWSFRRFSSAMAAATCCLALTSWPFMSAISWLSIFSGSSAEEMRSLMLERTTREKRSKMPIG
jgi:hypothetical protein